MARTVQKLSPLRVGRLTAPGMYADGGGLYLQVTAAAARSWIFRYMLHGRAREMGLGPLRLVTLAEARAAAQTQRQLRHAGHDPIETRKAAAVQSQLETAKAITFKAAAEAHIEAQKPGWKNAKHAEQWRATLETYAYPKFGVLPVQAVDVALVLRALEPIWNVKPETASRVRGRIESVLDWASARGYRTGENPARWRGHLENLLPQRSKVRAVRHHPALPYVELGAFMAALRQQDNLAALALEFLILTATRTNETIAARWAEIDEAARVWVIPAERIKAGREHRVPLSPAALAVLKRAAKLRENEDDKSAFLFPGNKRGRALSNMAMLALLHRMGRNDLTAHGFRSTFKDWATERTNFAGEVSEAALAHAIGDKTEAAYRRGDLFAKRERLMSAWAKFCAVPSPAMGTLVPLHASLNTGI